MCSPTACYVDMCESYLPTGASHDQSSKSDDDLNEILGRRHSDSFQFRREPTAISCRSGCFFGQPCPNRRLSTLQSSKNLQTEEDASQYCALVRTRYSGLTRPFRLSRWVANPPRAPYRMLISRRGGKASFRIYQTPRSDDTTTACFWKWLQLDPVLQDQALATATVENRYFHNNYQYLYHHRSVNHTIINPGVSEFPCLLRQAPIWPTNPRSLLRF